MLRRFSLFALSACLPIGMALFALSVPLFSHAATADLRVIPADIRFSKSPLIVGDSIRIYTKVQNVGTIDVTGYVTFYQGSSVIDEPQVISVVAGSNPEEAYVDFVVPEGQFNIRTVISGTKPVDANLDNNVAITGMFTPIPDKDRDGKQDASDNCPNVANADQADLDGDGLGDACDDDIDGDGLTNAVEAELGTNARAKDTDGDGALDAQDAYPLDPKRTVIEKPVPVKVVPKPVPEQKTEEQKTTQAESVATTNNTTPPDVQTSFMTNIAGSASILTTAADDLLKQSESSNKNISPNAIFTYKKTSWNTFVFRLITPVQERFVYEWNFGDGVRSSKTDVTHAYAQSGSYTVTLKTTDESGAVSEESAQVHVAFFTFSNPLVWLIVSLLGIALLASFAVWLKTKTKKNIKKKVKITEAPEDTELKKIHVKEE